MLRVLAILIGVVVPLAAAQAKTEHAALEVARNWLGALERGDMQVLTKTTSVPFTYSTTAKVKRCEQTVSAQKELSSWVSCIRKADDLLMAEIRQSEVMPADHPNVESKEMKRLASKITVPGTWVKAYINGDGVTFTFRFLLVEGAVAAFLVDSDFLS
jgi:hypothetical protein